MLASQILTRLTQFPRKLSQKFRGSTAQGALWILLSRLTRTVLQGVYFLLVARTLGAEQYGTFIGVSALVRILLPLASWGSSEILMKHVSRKPEQFNTYWGNALAMLGFFGTLCFGLLLGVSGFVLPPSAKLLLVVCIGLADLFFSRVLEIALKAFMALDLPHLDAQFHVLLTVNSVVAALCLAFLVPAPTLTLWGILYMLSRFVTMVMAVFVVDRMLGKPKLVLAWIKPELSEGFYFGMALSAHTLSSDLDKTMLARLGTLESAGIYGAAYRVVDVAIAPVMSLAAVAYAKFFRAGVDGVRGSLQVARQYIPLAGGYGIFASLSLFLLAPLIPSVLGEEYVGAVLAVRWLSPILFLRSIQFFAADTLTGAGLQGSRTALQVGVALVNGLGNLVLIPRYSWRGAAWASLFSDTVLTLGLLLLIFGFYQTQKAAAEDLLRSDPVGSDPVGSDQ